jgi:hypothetical protein
MDRGAALNCRVVHNWQEPAATAEVSEEPDAVEEATEE